MVQLSMITIDIFLYKKKSAVLWIYTQNKQSESSFFYCVLQKSNASFLSETVIETFSFFFNDDNAYKFLKENFNKMSCHAMPSCNTFKRPFLLIKAKRFEFIIHGFIGLKM